MATLGGRDAGAVLPSTGDGFLHHPDQASPPMLVQARAELM